jgi:hypothetical protein
MWRARTRACLVGMAALLAGTAAAQAGGEGEVVRRRVRCGDTIRRSTWLTHDLACPGTRAPALTVAGPGVVLDLGGHTVHRTGLDSEGVSEGIRVLANSTVRNGTIRGFSVGYVLDSGEDVRLSRLTFLNNGVAVYNRIGSFTTFTITDSRLVDNRVGLGSEQDAANGTFKVRSTLFSGHRLAFSANFHSVEVVRSTFSFNDLVFWCPDGSVTFQSSRIVRNGVVGWIPLGEFGYGSCDRVSFAGTVIESNGAFAPDERPAWEPFDLELRDSWVADNGSGLVARARTLDVQDNIWWNNGSGLTVDVPPEFLQPAVTGTIHGNRFLHNRGDGLRVAVPSTLTVSRNSAIGNTGWGLYVPGVIDGGGNAARDNGAGGCAGVTCGFMGGASGVSNAAEPALRSASPRWRPPSCRRRRRRSPPS